MALSHQPLPYSLLSRQIRAGRGLASPGSILTGAGRCGLLCLGPMPAIHLIEKNGEEREGEGLRLRLVLREFVVREGRW